MLRNHKKTSKKKNLETVEDIQARFWGYFKND